MSEAVDLRIVGSVFLTFLVLMLAGIAIPKGNTVLVVGYPGTSEARMMQIVAAANGSFVERGGQSWLAVVYSDAPGLSSRLMTEGAMLVLDHALAVGCSKEN
ncbi:hypothetical protein ASG39_07055 [Rhizobium sp. Leaf371]|uniref:hypothetical protein n=1 Tax=Rhizobium sp. Leaf371 TaxID=1736355 RepID=UPI0007158992|nr:hypothetical protein [Rhizobium sp. Leaf371]KQS68077.1 hypothetical protein ASG39_07055 [Rhizobium sp. Leaf371]